MANKTFYYDIDTDKYYTFDKASGKYKELKDNQGGSGGGGGGISLPKKNKPQNKQGQDQQQGGNGKDKKDNGQNGKDDNKQGQGQGGNKDKNKKDKSDDKSGQGNSGDKGDKQDKQDQGQQGGESSGNWSQKPKKPIRLGDRGDKAAQDRERAEVEKNDKGDYEPADWSDYIDIKGKDLGDLLQDKDFVKELANDVKQRKQAEIDKKIAADQQRAHKKYINSPKKKIKDAVDDFLAINNIGKSNPELSYSFKNNNQQVDPNIIVQGYGVKENTDIPILDVYFDRSGSWREDKLKVGRAIVNDLIDRWEKNKKLKVNVFYFSDEIFTDYDDYRADQCTGAGPLIWEQIRYRQKRLGVENVLIMTDNDIDRQGGADLTPIKLRGVAILIFKGGRSKAVISNLKGRGTTMKHTHIIDV